MPETEATPQSEPTTKPVSTIGEPFVWLCGMGLAVGLALITFLLLLIVYKGTSVFWPQRVAVITTVDDASGDEKTYAGRVVLKQDKGTDESSREWQLFVGNKDAFGYSFVFIDADHIRSREQPGDIVVAERLEYGDAIFVPVALRLEDGTEITAEADPFDRTFHSLVAETNARRAEIYRLEKHRIGAINRRMSKLELSLKKVTAESDRERHAGLEAKVAELQESYNELSAEARTLRELQGANQLVYRLADGQERTQAIGDITRFHHPNRLGFFGKLGVFFGGIWSFLSEDPREANTEGGIFPAIFGTFVMTLLMSILVTPLGVIAAIYLREYAKQGFLVRGVRVSVNNLAGVPSIVFGVFGLGFFIYGIGSYIDGGPKAALAPASWWTVSLLAIGFIAVAVVLAVRNTPAPYQPPPPRWLRALTTIAWLAGVSCFVVAIAKCPFFHGFFRGSLPTPTYGTGGILWASLTLALLTLPVVIVATEEALAAVPRGVREAALACGASKWQMIQRVVLPSATPGVLTGIILAMARGAGEVAPLMLVGVVKLAPSLPLDTIAPFIHPERKFMHLGFHIYDLGFQSPDSEAAKPMVFATTLLLILLVIALNLGAILIRNHLRKKYAVGTF